MQNPDVSTRIERILKHLGDKWEALPLLSQNALKNIILTGLQTSTYEGVVLKNVAEYMVSTMNLHLWNMVAILKEHAEREGISAEDCEETLKDVLPEMTHLMEVIQKRLSIQTLDDLATLVNITTSLLILSQSDLADDAQNWLYDLPELYHGRLQQEHLLKNASVYKEIYTSYPMDDKVAATGGVRKIHVSTPSSIYIEAFQHAVYPPVKVVGA